MSDLTQDHLKDRLRYDPSTGTFIWRERPNDKRWNVRYADRTAGTKDTKGYIQIKVDSHRYLAHRLAWLYMTGAWPDNDIDHINGQCGDNRWCNIREATRTENMRNQTKVRKNTSSVTGVSWNRQRGKWESYIRVDRNKKHLGLFTVKQDAIDARQDAELKYFGSFSPNLPR